MSNTNPIQSQLDQVLAPCPFCGDHDAELINGEDWDEGFSVSCQACWLTLGSFATEGEAIAAWNKRAIRAAVGGEAVAWMYEDKTGRRLVDLKRWHPAVVAPAGVTETPLYASPTATVDVGALRGLCDRWRKQAQDCEADAIRMEGQPVANELMRDAAQYRQSAFQLAALIGEKA